MPHFSVIVDCPVKRTFRVDQVCGIFDLKPAKKSRETFAVELPDESESSGEEWQIGVIVGPSGSGKSTVARHAYGDRFHEGGFAWPKDKSVLDGFDGAHDVKQITHLLTSVGFSSPPAWVRPYHVLSGGQRFRCDLARALLTDAPLVAFDEFTSVVDRNVAKIGSVAVAKSIRKGRIGKKFVAVTCHYDILDWLEPDWVLDMATCQLARGLLQRRIHRRPPIELDVRQVGHAAWEIFRRHHYLNTSLSKSAKCFVAFWGAEPVAFSAWTHQITRMRRRGDKDKREHRTVVLPDYQGVGIGNRLSEFVAALVRGSGGRAFSTTSHPAMIRYRSASPAWERRRLGRVAPMGQSARFLSAGRSQMASCSIERLTAGFEYVGPPRAVAVD